MKQFFSLRGWRGGGSGPQPSLGFGKLQVHELTTVKPVSGGDATNKAGRLVFRGQTASGPVKVYEAASGQHARFIDSVSRLTELDAIFPSMLAMQGNFVVAEWVAERRGRQPSPSPAAMAELLGRIHAAPLAAIPAAGFDYWHDLIRPRFLRAADLFGRMEYAARIVDAVDAAWSRRRYLMHPDVTRINLVLDCQDRWRVIDNELLTVGGLPLLDVCNASRSLPESQRQELLNLYLTRTGTTVSADDVTILEAAWLAREVGAAFVSGKTALPLSLFEAHENGESVLPLSIAIVRQREWAPQPAARMASPRKQAGSI